LRSREVSRPEVIEAVILAQTIAVLAGKPLLRPVSRAPQRGPAVDPDGDLLSEWQVVVQRLKTLVVLYHGSHAAQMIRYRVQPTGNAAGRIIFRHNFARRVIAIDRLADGARIVPHLLPHPPAFAVVDELRREQRGRA